MNLFPSFKLVEAVLAVCVFQLCRPAWTFATVSVHVPCPAQTSWLARFWPRTASRTHTQHWDAQNTFPNRKPQYRKHTAVPVNCTSHPLAWSLGTGSCLVLVICFSHLNVVFKSVQPSVISMLFSKLCNFISYFFVAFLWYLIMLLFSIYKKNDN
jgi:hypothetical protein